MESVGEKLFCRTCQADVEPLVELLEPRPGGHYAKAICSCCHSYLKFLPKPIEEAGISRRKHEKRSRADISLCAVVRANATRCAYCGRKAQNYEAHHSWALEDGGPQADSSNVVALCHECHGLANWRQKQERERAVRDSIAAPEECGE